MRGAGRYSETPARPCSCSVRFAGFADAVEDAARLGLLLGLKAEERIFERHMLIGGIQPHGFAELIARGFVFSDLEKGVGEIFADGRAVRRKSDGLLKAGDGLIVDLSRRA